MRALFSGLSVDGWGYQDRTGHQASLRTRPRPRLRGTRGVVGPSSAGWRCFL